MIHEFYLENWKEYEEIYKEWQDKAKENFAVNSSTVGFDVGQPGIPNLFDNKIRNEYSKLMQKDYPNFQFGKVLNVWGVYYRDGGYQTLHRHNQDSIATVLFLDEQPESEKLTSYNGMLYTVNNNDYKSFRPEPGKLIVMNWDVWHGVYPATEPRRSFMVDFAI